MQSEHSTWAPSNTLLGSSISNTSTADGCSGALLWANPKSHAFFRVLVLKVDH